MRERQTKTLVLVCISEEPEKVPVQKNSVYFILSFLGAATGV